MLLLIFCPDASRLSVRPHQAISLMPTSSRLHHTKLRKRPEASGRLPASLYPVGRIIYQEKGARGAGKGRVKPSEVVRSLILFGHIGLV